MRGLFREHIAEKSIVGAYEEPYSSMQGDSCASAADAGIYHADEDGVRGKVAIGGGENPRAGGDLLWWDCMGDINGVRIGRDSGDDAFHNADIPVSQAKVGQ